MITRNRTPSKDIDYGLYLYFLGLSTRRGVANKAMFFLYKVKRSHVLLAKKWNWIQKYKSQLIKTKHRKIAEFIADETLIKAGSEYIWLRVVIEPQNRGILALLQKSKDRKMFVAERGFFQAWSRFMDGKQPVSTDGGTWYPQACRFLKLDHHIHSPYEKSIIERTMQYIKDRTECFDDYFPCRIKNYKLKHVMN